MRFGGTIETQGCVGVELALMVSSQYGVENQTAISMIVLMATFACWFQTCIVLRRTPQYILAGADSKSTSDILVSDDQGLSIKDGAGASIQKIKSANKIFFASAGIGRVASFDVDVLAAQACDEATSVPVALENFRRLALAPLGNVLALIRSHWPDYFRRKAVDAAALEIAFFGMDGPTPTLAAVSVSAIILSETAIDLEQRLYTCPGTMPLDLDFSIYLSRTKASEGLGDKASWDANALRVIKDIIMTEAKARPDTVSPPVRILRLDKHGSRWVK